MAGTCTFTFDERRNATVVGFVMDVGPTKAWMDPPLPLVGWVVGRSFDGIMREGGDGLRRRLSEGVASASTQTILVGA